MPFDLELNSINQIEDSERRGVERDLFWPWCGANVSVLAISYGAFFLGFGINFWQASLAAVIGTVLSFLLVLNVLFIFKSGINLFEFYCTFL